MSKKNILDEFWIDWDQKEWKDKYETMKKVAHRLMEEIPSREDLINLGNKTKNLEETRDWCFITPSEETLEKFHQELMQKYGEDYSPWAKIEMPCKEAREYRSRYERGEMTIGKFTEKLKHVPRGATPVLFDHLWINWEAKSLEEQVHLVMFAIGNHPHGVMSGIDLFNENIHQFYVEDKLGYALPAAY